MSIDMDKRMANSKWSNIPSEILAVIAKRPNMNRTDIRRLRAVCSSWRSCLSSCKNSPRFPLRVPFPHNLLPESTDDQPSFVLTQNTRLIISPPRGHSIDSLTPWVIHIEEAFPNKWSLIDFIGIEEHFRLSGHINLLDYRVTEIHSTCDFKFDENGPTISIYILFKNILMFRIESIIVVDYGELDDADGGSFTLFTLYNSGNLAFWRYGSDKWDLLENNGLTFLEIICFKGDLYVVEKGGRLMRVAVGTCSLVCVVTEAPEGGLDNNSLLVEFDGLLYLVTYSFSLDYDNLISLKVYVMNEGNGTWDRTYDLRKGVFFVNYGNIFAVSAKDLGLPKGNIVSFEGMFDRYDSKRGRTDVCSRVYDLHLNSHWWPNRELFWPPPSWIKEAKRLNCMCLLK